MTPLKIYTGWDPRDELAYRACVSSLLKHSTIPLRITPLKDYELRRHNIYSRAYFVERRGQMIDRNDSRPFSTQFSFTRFGIPLIDKSDDWVIFCDADFLWRADVAELVEYFDDSKKLMCVQHDYRPEEITKFDGMSQKKYNRKNWSSLMAFRPARLPITKALLNGASGKFLHAFGWLEDEEIGGLPEEWNWLEGWSPDSVIPKVVHYTRGTPDMNGRLPYDEEWWAAVNEWHPGMSQHGVFPCV